MSDHSSHVNLPTLTARSSKPSKKRLPLFGREAAQAISVSAAVMGVGASLGFIPGFLATALREDLGVSRGAVGLIVSLYFGCTGLGSILGGRLTERFGARSVVVFDMLLVAVAGAMVAVVAEYWAWLLAAVFAGSGYALANAGTNVAIAHSTPAHRRTLAMSLKTAGVPAMAAIAAAIGPYTADRWSWQILIWGTAGLGLLTAVTAALILQPSRTKKSQQPKPQPLPPGMKWFVVAAFLLIAGSQPLYSWTVAYLEQSLDASPGGAGAITAVGSAVGACLMILNGVRADRIGAARRIPRIITLVSINAIATTLVLSGLVAGISVVIVGAVIGMAAQLATIGTMHAAVIDRVPNAVARATGVTMTGYYLGALVSPAAFGAIADATGTFAWSWLTTIVLLILSIPAWILVGRIPIANHAEQDSANSTQIQTVKGEK